MTIEDQDLKARLRLANEKISRLQMEVEELLDMREMLRQIMVILDYREQREREDPTLQRWIDWSRNAVELVKAKQRMQPQKKEPGHGPHVAAERRAEMARLWAAERDKS